MNKNLVAVWNKSQTTYPVDKAVSPYARRVADSFPKQSYVCEVGAGTGTDTRFFIEQGHTVVALDISNVGLDIIKEKAQELHQEKKLQTFQVDFNDGSLPLEADSIDVVYSRLALHYFSYDTTVQIFKELYRICKVSAKAYITIKSPDDKKEMDYLQSTAKQIEPGLFEEKGKLKSRFNTDQWNSILQAAGIKQYTIHQMTEDMTGRNDIVKSGNKMLQLIELQFTKNG